MKKEYDWKKKEVRRKMRKIFKNASLNNTKSLNELYKIPGMVEYGGIKILKIE